MRGNEGGLFSKKINPSEMFGNCMIEYSYVECTASCIVGLMHAKKRFGHLLERKDLLALNKAVLDADEFLRSVQEESGGWPGFWGVNYTYGTYFGIAGALAAGAAPNDGAIQLAVEWILDHELASGGWGESYLGMVEERYIPHDEAQLIMTSWAVMSLLKAKANSAKAKAAIERGIDLILERQQEDGSWPKEGVGGAFFNTAMHHYMLYKDTFTIWALSLYAQRLLEESESIGEEG